DTDPVQWQVLDRAFSGHATMVLIGDPKQAIYAFRGGDVTTYLAAADTATKHATLNVNRRSDEALLDSMQKVLGGAALGDPKIVVHGVTAAHPDSRLVGAPSAAPFRLRMVDRERFDVRPGKGVPIGELRSHVAKDLALDVKALLAASPTFDGRPLQPRDVAVLCSTNVQCQAAWQGLADAGIPAVIAGAGSVFKTDGAAVWLSLLEAMEQPHRSSRVRAAGLTSFFGHTAAELDEAGDAVTDAIAETVRDWSDLFRQRGVAAVFEAATSANGVLARLLSQVDGERLATDLRHTAESLHDVATRERLGLVALVGWLREQMAEDKQSVSGARTRRLDSDAAAVQILTIHGSKGLQFPVVYLPSVCDRFPRTPEVPLFHDEHGRRCIDVGGSQAVRANIGRAVEELAGEDLRLLYVAMTRAQSQLVTWWFPNDKNTIHSALHRMLFGRGPGQPDVPTGPPLPTDEHAREIGRRWEAAGGPVLEGSEWQLSLEPRLAASSDPLSVRQFTRKVDTAWRRTSYSALSSAATAAADQSTLQVGSEPENPPRDDEPDLPVLTAVLTSAIGPTPVVEPVETTVVSPMATLPVGATFGSLVHAVLEHTDPAAPDQGGDLRAEVLHHIDEQLVRWPVELDREVLADAVVAICDSPLGPLAPGATLRQLGRADRMCELDFELPLAGGDDRSYAAGHGSLRDLGGLLRRHLQPGDPLLPYADAVDDDAHAQQELVGYLSGSVDVVLRVGGRFVVVDYKTNWLGGFDEDQPLTAAAYRPAALAEAMTHSSYPLQALLYAVVLHRFLRWRLPGYRPEDHFGGVVYLYLRGMCGPKTPVIDGEPCGVFSWRPPIALVEELSDLLDGLRPQGAVA
ncbi:MAG: exodeoxyribonuclease subunit beta, partial [Marmoricola sp.]|nr:exodeoxyribonuclease subunit beta [Marmoricola sp.]